MEIYLALAIPILITTAWLYTAQMTRTSLPILRNKRVCLLIAHPDDEAMFFSPAITALTAEELGNHVKILCLSSGNADGLGATRKQELVKSAIMLGLRSASDILVLEDSNFPDSMTTTWPTDKIAQVLSSAFSPAVNQPSTKKARSSSSQAPFTTMDTLITFDSKGISSHPNHVSLYHGAKAWISSLMAGKAGWKCPVEMYTLTTTNMLRKYLSVLDAPTTLLIGGFRGAGLKKRKKTQEPPSLFFMSDFGDWRRGQNAMVQGHSSQMRWFRWGWIGIGRYMVVNDLKRETIT